MDDDTAHIENRIRKVLFPSPGDRLDQPEFGVRLERHVFEPSTPETRAALQSQVQDALQRWLADIIDVEDVQVKADEATLRVEIQYVVRRGGQRESVVFPVYVSEGGS